MKEIMSELMELIDKVEAAKGDHSADPLIMLNYNGRDVECTIYVDDWHENGTQTYTSFSPCWTIGKRFHPLEEAKQALKNVLDEIEVKNND